MTSNLNAPSGAGLKVIGAGLPRTSTRSLQYALEKLGFNPCYHVLSDIFPYAKTVGRKWGQICYIEDKTLRQEMLAEMAKSHEAATDAPWCFFLEDLLEMYPDAKFILTMRETPSVWLKSFMASVGKAFGHPLFYWIGFWSSETYGAFAMNNGYNALFKRRFGVDVRTLEAYELHNDWVRRVVPADRLLEHRAVEGWEPLCQFLDRPVPGEPYPWVNDTATMERMVEGMIKKGLKRWLMVISVFAAVGVAWGFNKYL